MTLFLIFNSHQSELLGFSDQQLKTKKCQIETKIFTAETKSMIDRETKNHLKNRKQNQRNRELKTRRWNRNSRVPKNFKAFPRGPKFSRENSKLTILRARLWTSFPNKREKRKITKFPICPPEKVIRRLVPKDSFVFPQFSPILFSLLVPYFFSFSFPLAHDTHSLSPSSAPNFPSLFRRLW